MAVSVKVLESKYGITEDRLRSLFEAQTPPEKIQKLLNLTRDRIVDGRDQNFSNCKAWKAVDVAMQSDFDQTIPTLLRNLMTCCNQVDPAKFYTSLWGELKRWDIERGYLFAQDPESGKVNLNIPMFWDFLVPLTPTIVAQRTATLFNARNQNPLLKYNPREYTQANRLRCEAETSLVSKISDDLGYAEVLREAIFHTQLYAESVMFPCETWYTEKQEGVDGAETVAKEGIRYTLPHRSRWFYDMAYPLNTLNTDSGCEFIGHWDQIKYGDIKNSSKFWNKEAVAKGQNWWATGAGKLYQTLYPCRTAWPREGYDARLREDKASIYQTNEMDQGVSRATIFQKLIPAEWDLSDPDTPYRNPVWFRFDMASDITPLWVGPVGYTPGVAFTSGTISHYDRNPSLALKTLAWQELITNLWTQFVVTLKQNLANITLWNSELLNQEDIKKLKSDPRRLYDGINLIPFSSEKSFRQKVDPEKALYNFQLAKQQLTDHIVAISRALDLMQRLLMVSDQDYGQTASHEQTAAEMRVLTTANSQFSEFIGSYIDSGVSAWLKQLHDATQQYATPDFIAQVTPDVASDDAVLKSMGFEVTHPQITPDGKVGIKGKVKDLALTSFASIRDGPNRISDEKIAGIVMQAVAQVANSPVLSAQLDPTQLIRLIEQAVRSAGGPKDFKLGINPQGNGMSPIANQVLQIVGKQFEQFAGEMKQQVEGEVNSIAEPITGALEKHAEIIKQLQDALGKIIPMTQPPAQPMPQVNQPLPNVASQAPLSAA